MSDEHTEGPWRIEPKEDRKGARGYWLHDDNGEYIALVCRQDDEARELPIARLIAGAPELLAALKLVRDDCSYHLSKYRPAQLAAVIAAISKTEA